MAKKRNYRKEYDNYQGKPDQIKRRASRNQARREMMKEGKVHKRDGKDVGHQNDNPLDNKKSNLRVETKHGNRSFPRDKKAGHKRKKR